MFRNASLVLAGFLLLGSGLLHGARSGRWTGPEEMARKIATLEKAPLAFAGWQGEPKTLDRRSREVAGIDGYIVRRYTERRTGRSVLMMLVCGRPGPISVHSPEVCYAGAGYEALGTTERRSLAGPAPGQTADFWTVEFEKAGVAVPQKLEVIYGWTTDGRWQASSSPRFDFGGASSLYKLYVIREFDGLPPRSSDDSAWRFLKAFLPELNSAVFGRAR